MFDKAIIINELKECIEKNDSSINLNEVADNFKVINGFYVFRINDDAHFFLNNTFVESAPGYFAIERGDDYSRGH